MNLETLNDKIVNSTKWSTITELIAKLLVPVTNMILARILIPEHFAVVATITMIISFVDMFSDAGFQKYLVHKEFRSTKELEQSAHVAFWTNFGISMLFWVIIIVLSDQIAKIVGSPHLGHVIAIACVQLPITSLSSIQMALFRRKFDFRTLFHVRLVSIFLPFIITIPLALSGLGYWALIIGSISGLLSNALILTIKSDWKPRFFYKFSVFKEMFSFSFWTLFQSFSVWLTSWIDVFVIGKQLDAYHLGIYKTSLVTVSGIINLVTAIVTPVLISSLSRLQSDEERFKQLFLNMQRIAAFILFPMGVIMFFFSDLITYILLGRNWIEASAVIAPWGLMAVLVVVYSNFCSNVYIAKGKPKISLVTQIIYLIILIPTCFLTVNFGFIIMVYARTLTRIVLIISNLVAMQYFIKIRIKEMLFNTRLPLFCSAIMGVSAILLDALNVNASSNILNAIISAVLYIGLLLICAKKDVKDIIRIVTKRKKIVE